MMTATHYTVPWRLQDEGPLATGALTEDQVKTLSAAFSLDGESVQRLSEKLVMALSRELTLAQSERQKTQEHKGVHTALMAARELIAAEERLARATSEIANIQFMPDLLSLKVVIDDHRNALNFSRESMAEVRRFLEVMSRVQQVRVDEIPDGDGIVDLRREIVCVSIFKCWLDANRMLTFTTHPITSERSGAVIMFCQAVVECITEPQTRLPGELINAELDAYNACITVTTTSAA